MDSERQPFCPTVCGLDLSFSGTGFCCLRGSDLKLETISTAPETFENDLARLKHIANEVVTRLGTPDLVVLEDVFTPFNPKFVGAALKLVMLSTAVRLALYDAKVQFLIVADTQLKKFCTGKGVSPKSMILLEVYKKWNVNCADDNQADAYVLARMGIACLVPDEVLTEFPQYQQEVIAKVKAERPWYRRK